MQTLVERQPLLVSFNGICFDFALMRALLRYEGEIRSDAVHVICGNAAQYEGRKASLWHLCDQFKAQCAQSYDILHEIWKVDPESKFKRGLNSLDAIAQANGFPAKTLSGVTAPRLWAAGRHADVLNYCSQDVLKTRLLFEQVGRSGQILRGDGLPIQLPRPVLP